MYVRTCQESPSTAGKKETYSEIPHANLLTHNVRHHTFAYLPKYMYVPYCLYCQACLYPHSQLVKVWYICTMLTQ